MKPAEPTAKPAFAIRSGAVGSVELGKPMPRELAAGEWRTRMVADGQPWQGFELADPPLAVGIGPGPRGEAPVTSIDVRGPGPATATGIAVGSTLAALRAAYPDLSLHQVPPTLGDDECVAATGSLAGVFFVFRSCPDAESGAAVTRIDVRPP